MLITDFEAIEIESGREQAIEVLADFISLGSAEENEVFDDDDYFDSFLSTAKSFADQWEIPFDIDLVHQSLMVNMKEYYGDAWLSSSELCEC